MAFSSTSRSFTNIGSATTVDSKSTGTTTLNTGFPSAGNAWGWSSIWATDSLTNGVTSRSTTRDNSRSRDRAHRASAGEAVEIPGKTGSASLVDSSVSEDWSYRSAWGAKRSLPSGRSISHARDPETSTSQQRSVSNVGLPPPFSSAQNPSVFASRPPTINLTATTTQHRPNFGPAFSGSAVGRGSEPPPNVYTKFDRAGDPNARTLPDSAKEGSWADVSPTEERKPFFPGAFGARTVSTPASRDGSGEPSRHGEEQPSFTRPDWSRPTQRPTQNNSRAASLSSQGASFHNSFTPSNADRLASELAQLNMNGDRRPVTSYRPSTTARAVFTHPPPTTSGAPAFPRAGWNGTGGGLDIDEVEDVDRTNVNYLGLDAFAMPQKTFNFPDFASGQYAGRFVQTPTASDFRHAQTFSNGSLSGREFDIPTGPRSTSEWQNRANATLPPNRESPTLQEQPAYLDPRMQQMLANQLRSPYGAIYNPYAVTTPIQLSAAAPYMPLVPMGLPAIDQTAGSRDPAGSDAVQSALMYEFKSNTKSKRYELKDIYDHIAEFSGDQHGSRFIQTKLESANSDEKERVFREIQPNALQLMTDVFGNYVIQKFFEHGDQTHKKILANAMKGHVLNLSLQMYGCRVVQKALDHVLVDQQAALMSELKDHVLRCVKDQNGNHVIQKAIERCPSSTVRSIVHSFKDQVQQLSIHTYGCRVIQRCLERCDPESKAMIMSELMEGIHGMIQDQFGNYVVQHIVAHDEGEGRRHVLDIVGRGLETFSKHKFASNVVEKCLEMADNGWRRQVAYALANANGQRADGDTVLVSMIKDNFGNYVIQKLLDTLCLDDYLYFMDYLQTAMQQAKRTGCGKQVMSIEKRMHRFQYRSTPTNGSSFHPNAFQLPLPTPPFASNYGSAATTPPPLTADSQSRQSSAIPSINGDAVEGATVGSRKGSDESTGCYMR